MNNLINEVKDYHYKGFHLYQNNDLNNPGWVCVIGETEFLFRTAQQCKTAIDTLLKGYEPIIIANGGIKLRKVLKNAMPYDQ